MPGCPGVSRGGLEACSTYLLRNAAIYAVSSACLITNGLTTAFNAENDPFELRIFNIFHTVLNIHNSLT